MLGSTQIRGIKHMGLVPDFTQQILTNLVRLGNTVFSQVPVTERTDHAIGVLLRLRVLNCDNLFHYLTLIPAILSASGVT